MKARDKMIARVCAKFSATNGMKAITALAIKEGVSITTLYRIWKNNKELCK